MPLLSDIQQRKKKETLVWNLEMSVSKYMSVS